MMDQEDKNMTTNKVYVKNITSSRDEFFLFLKVFKGSLIFRGNKSRAIKIFDNILYKIKMHFLDDPIFVFFKVYNNLLPMFSVYYKRFGNRYQPIPKIYLGTNRVILMVSWLIKSLKGKYVIGVREDDIVKAIIDAYNLKGHAINQKLLFYKKVLSGRFFLSSTKDYISDFKYRDKIYNKLIMKKNDRRKRRRKKRI